MCRGFVLTAADPGSTPCPGPFAAHYPPPTQFFFGLLRHHTRRQPVAAAPVGFPSFCSLFCGSILILVVNFC